MGPGQRKGTTGRYLVDDIMRALDNHGYIPIPTSEVVSIVSRRRSGVVASSVLNALETLARNGKIQKIKLSNLRVLWRSYKNVISND